MRAIGFRAMEWNIGFNDGVAGREYNESANSRVYDHGFRRGRFQRRVERVGSAIMGLAIGLLIALQVIWACLP